MNFIKSFGTYGLIPVISKSIGFLLIPIYTNYLSVTEFGVQDMFTVFKSLAAFFIVLEMYSGVGRYFFEYKNITERKKLISSAFNLQLILTVVVLLVIIVFNSQIYNTVIGLPEYKIVYWYVVLWIPFNAIIQFCSVIVRYDNKPKQFLFITIGQLLVRVLLTIYLVVILERGVEAVFISQLVGSIIATIGFCFLLRKYYMFYIDKGMLNKVLRYSLPLIPGVFFVYLEPNISRYLIRINLSIYDLGYYALALRIVSVFAIVGLALKMVWQPFFFEMAEKEPKKLNNKVRDIFNMFFYSLLVFSLIITLFSEELVYLAANESYKGSVKLIGLLCLSTIILIITQITSIGINYVNKTHIVSNITIVSIFIGLFVLYFFLKDFGLMIVPISVFLASLFRLFSSLYYTKKYMGLDFQSNKILLLIALTTILNVIIIKYKIPLPYKLLIILLLAFYAYSIRKVIFGTLKRVF